MIRNTHFLNIRPFLAPSNKILWRISHVLRFVIINVPKYVFQNRDIRGKSIVTKSLIAASGKKPPYQSLNAISKNGRPQKWRDVSKYLEKFLWKNSVKNDLSWSIGPRWILDITNFHIVEEEGGLRNPSSNNRDPFQLLNHVYLINMFNIHDERNRCIDFGPSKIIQASRDSRTAVVKL